MGQQILDGFRNVMVASGASPRTVNKVLSYLAAIIGWGVDSGLCKPMPGKLPRFPRRKIASPPRQPLTAQQVDALYAAIEPEYRVLFLLMVDHGLRKEEALGLCVESINLEHKMITVHGKGNKYRSVPFMSERFERELQRVIDSGTTSGPVVVNPVTGKPYSSLRKALLRASALAGVPMTGHHILRHTFASRMAEKGLPPYVLQRLMGHTSQETTDKIYVHIGQDFVANEARRIAGR